MRVVRWSGGFQIYRFNDDELLYVAVSVRLGWFK